MMHGHMNLKTAAINLATSPVRQNSSNKINHITSPSKQQQ
jgi:hypothetical protein